MSRPVFLLLVPAFLTPIAASAAVFAPTTAAELQTALTTAAASAEDDVINLQAGTTYFTSDNGNATFTYNSSNNGSLTIAGAGPGSSILDGNVARQVLELISSGTTASFQISGLTIRNGRFGDVAGLEVQGVEGDQSLTDCVIVNNLEGGAAGGASMIASGASDQTVAGCSIQDNTGGNVGGIQLATNGNIQFNENLVIGNSISSGFGLMGGAIMTSHGVTTSIEAKSNEVRNNAGDVVNGIYLSASAGASMLLEGNTIADNQNLDATNTGGAQIQSIGNSDITVRSNVITGNSSDLANGCQIFNGGEGDILLEENTISNNVNSAGFVGGILITNVGSGNGATTLQNNTISGNSGSFATGIQIQNSENGILTLESNILANNVNDQADNGGAQIQQNGSGELRIVNNLVFGNSAAAQGGGFSIVSAAETLTLVNNTIVGNSVVANDGVGGGGVLLTPVAGMVAANIYNNILFGNSAAPANTGNDLLVDFVFPGIQLFNNDFSQACFGPPPANCDPTSVAGLSLGKNIGADPLFVNPEAGNFQLGPDSPALDTGDTEAPGLPDLDLAGNPRVFNGQVDMGAFEAQPLLTADPATLDFGFVSIGEEESQGLSLSNTGAMAVAISGFQLSDSANYELDLSAGENPCGSSSFSLNPGESCSLAVAFGPGAEGELNANLQVETDSAIPTVVQLIGSGQGGGGSGGCALGGGAALGRGLWFALLIPISAVALFFRRRR
ncbi:MAG TPA: choice-of-anchor D domain-containing protein [bacterium]|nr:choice-of-anchor D domain-containing protein [bacterium]